MREGRGNETEEIKIEVIFLIVYNFHKKLFVVNFSAGIREKPS
jgi:hypothetical protein